LSLISYIGKALNDFRGAWTIRDQTGQNASRGSVAKNVRLNPGQFFTRPGMAIALAFDSAIQSMYNWIATDSFYGQLSRLVYLKGTNSINLYDLGAAVNNALYTRACLGLSVVEADTRLYIGHYDALGRAAGGARICNGWGHAPKAFTFSRIASKHAPASPGASRRRHRGSVVP